MEIKTIKYNDFKSFYKDVSLYGKLHDEFLNYIFRGESSGKYELIPSALRSNNVDKLYLNSKPIDEQWDMEVWQQIAEYNLISSCTKIKKNLYC